MIALTRQYSSGIAPNKTVYTVDWIRSVGVTDKAGQELMLISLNWLRDFVDVPADIDPRSLALQFTTTTAEVEGVEHVTPNFYGLVAAEIESVRSQPGEDKLRTIVANIGRKKLSSLTSAPDIAVGDRVIYAPPGAQVGGHTVGTTDPQGRPAEGMIVAGQGLGLVPIGANAIFLPPSVEPGSPIDPAIFDDWIIEIDNKSITHRPDLWGHYGIAREVAAMLERPLRPYDVVASADLQNPTLPTIPIEIDDATKCPRYSGLLIRGLKAQPAPLWMQVRLAHVGMRPINLLVDLTNYVMADLGQPMHAFDGTKVTRIEVANASPKEKFRTLDGVDRTLPDGTLMIQCNRKSIAIAGVMGGAETEVGDATETLLLESATFDAPTIRRAATAMGHRTDASARFEKSLDPRNTVLGIGRFCKLAMAELPAVEFASTLSDCYPSPATPAPIALDCAFAARFIGKPVSPDEIVRILERLEFHCERDGETLRVTPPSYRATKDISIEADLIEEVARFIGYNNIEPSLPIVTARHFAPSPDLTLEHRTLDYLCVGGEFNEVYNYIWYEDEWLRTLGDEPGECFTLQNPAAENCSRFRKSLVPGLLAMAERNRHHYARFQLLEIGSVFTPGPDSVEAAQRRHLGLLAARAGKKADAEVWDQLRTALDGWARNVLESEVTFRATAPKHPWEDAHRLADIAVDGRVIGRITVLPLACKQSIDERLKPWAIATAEMCLTDVTDCLGRHDKLPIVPRFPQVELDFSVLVDATRRYDDVEQLVARFDHPLLSRVSFVEAYEGGSVPAGRRSLTFRAAIGRDDRTLREEEIHECRDAFQQFFKTHQMELRA